MDRGSLLDEATSGLRIDVPGYHLATEIKLRLLTLVLGMEVRRLMLPVEHTNHDSKESRDDRHAIKFTAACKIFGEAVIAVGRPVARTAPARIPACRFLAPFWGGHIKHRALRKYSLPYPALRKRNSSSGAFLAIASSEVGIADSGP